MGELEADDRCLVLGNVALGWWYRKGVVASPEQLG